MKKLPLGVAVIAVLVIIEAILEILAAFGLFGIGSLGVFVAEVAPGFALIMIGVLFLVIGLIELAVGMGLFNMERWAWLLTVIVVWIDLVADVLAGFLQVQSFNSVLLSVIIPLVVLIYMYQGNVRKRFT